MPRKKIERQCILTVGHSTRTVAEFKRLLQAHGVQEVVDVRSIPRSRHNPQFNEPRIKRSLQRAGIGYLHLAELGGLRHPVGNSKNLGWRNASFRGFADYMDTEEFAAGLDALQRVATGKRAAIMCAEALPWRCHRSLIADALTKRRWVVRHITTEKAAFRHRLTPFLRMRRGRITYPSPDP